MSNRPDAVKRAFITHKHSFDIHNSNVHFLDTLAILLGCKEHIGASLPDGRRPDVMRVNTRRRFLFIGEGKNTETPGCLATQGRLWEYLQWLSANVSGNDRTGILAICFHREHEANKWLETIGLLAREANLLNADSGKETFSSGINVVWFFFRSCDNILPKKVKELSANGA